MAKTWPRSSRPTSCEAGISQVMEGRRIFAELTVDENLATGGFTIRDKAKNESSYARVMDLFPRLAERRSQVAGYMSGGEQQMLAIGRALMADPKLLDPRRALAGAGAHAGGADPRHHRGHQQPGNQRAAHRAERHHGAQHRQLRLHPRDRQGRDGRATARNSWPTTTSRSSTSASTARRATRSPSRT